MRYALTTHTDPKNVGTPMTPATQAQARPNISPDTNKDQIDDGWCEEEEREEELQYMMEGYALVS